MKDSAEGLTDEAPLSAQNVTSWKSKSQRRRAIAQHLAEVLDRIVAWQIPGEDERDRDYVRCRMLDVKELTRYVEAILDYRQQHGGGPLSILDVGTTLGILPLTLRRMGIDASACDHPRFNMYAEWMEREGVPYSSVDLMDGDLPYASESFDVVTFKQVIEHLPFSPKAALLNFHRILRPGGLLLLSTPNILRLSSLARLLGRRSIHPPVEQFFHSEFPFTGHYREYTLAELQSMLAWSGFDVLESAYLQQHDAPLLYRARERFARNRFARIGWKDILACAAWRPFTFLMPSLAQFIFVIARKPCS